MPDVVLTNGLVELAVPTTHGIRIARFGLCGDDSMFGEASQVSRETPAGTWFARGGHRLWTAPERFPESYTLDERPPLVERADERTVRVRQPAHDRSGFEKIVEVELAADAPSARVEHTLVNAGSAPVTCAAWALSIMRPGGTAIVQNAAFAPQPASLEAVRTYGLWSYTRLDDPRFRFGARFLRVRCDESLPEPQKIGLSNERGACAYVHGDTAFVKRVDYDGAAVYPDRGCSTEIYTAGAFLELETLGPLVTLAPGARTTHVETWWLLRGISPDDDDAIDGALRAAVAR